MNAHSTGRPPPRRPIPPLSVGRARLTGRACPPFPPALTDEGGGRRSSPIWRRPKTPEPGGAALAGVPIGRGFVRDRGGGGGGGPGGRRFKLLVMAVFPCTGGRWPWPRPDGGAESADGSVGRWRRWSFDCDPWCCESGHGLQPPGRAHRLGHLAH